MAVTFYRSGFLKGSGLQGYVRTSYDRIVDVFGEPDEPGDKTTAEWRVQFSDGTYATIYDYKTGSTPLGAYDWHVGGQNRVAVARVAEALGVEGSPLS